MALPKPEDQIPPALRVIRSLRVRGSEKPHKLLFLLTLARLYEIDPGRDSLFALDEALESAFGKLVEEFFPGNKHGAVLIEYPFFHLANDGFWSLAIKKGKESLFNEYANSPNMRPTRRRLIETVDGGSLEASLDRSMRDLEQNRRIQTYLSERIGQLAAGAAAPSGSAQLEDRAPDSLFAHEAAALSTIVDHIQTHNLGETLTNLELYDPQSKRYFETDLVVVARFGVYVVELKHWSGRIDVGPNSWLQNGSFYKPDPHKANNFKAKLLRGLYERKFPSLASLYFESVVVLTNPDVEATGCARPKSVDNNPTFESIDHFLDYLKNQRQIKEHRLTNGQCQSFAAYVRQLGAIARPRDFVFPGYEIVDRLYQYDDRAEVIARRTDLRYRRLSRLRIFYPSAGDAENRELAHERATATLNAVEKIGDHPNVLKVWDVPNENNYLVEGSDWSETGTLRDYLDHMGPLQPQQAMEIASGLASGLQAAHAQYVVHRALSPDNVLMVNEMPKLMNFDLSFQLEDNRVTVIPDATRLKRSPYTAPEIYTSGTVPEASADLFSLGVILYEMMVGATPFGCSTDLERSGGALGEEQRRKLRQCKDLPVRIEELLVSLIRLRPGDRIGDAAAVLAVLGGTDRLVAPLPAEANRLLSAGAQCGIYTIEEFLHHGAESQLYRAAGLRGRTVALKLFDLDVPQQRIVNEQSHAATAHHPSLVHVDTYNQWSDGRYFIAFDWVSNQSLRDEIENGAPPSIDRFCGGARQLIEALSCLHGNKEEDGTTKPILHNDVKPENILIGPGSRLVLVDFGAACEPGVAVYQGTEGYVAPDLRLGEDRKYSVDGDLYALSVTLHEWLVGAAPGHELETPGVPSGIQRWFSIGCAPKAETRFASAWEMERALEEAVAKVEPEGLPGEPETVVIPPFDGSEQALSELPMPDSNPFVSYLNSLHSRTGASENALAESQAMNPLFGHIHVPHPLATIIYECLVGREKRQVVLTGHAGDGKSTIGVEVYKMLVGLADDEPLLHALGRREDLTVRGVTMSIVKDFSEWSPSERVTLMSDLLAEDGSRFLLISNTGTLLDAFKKHYVDSGATDWASLESRLLGAMDKGKPTEIMLCDTPFVVVNVAMMDNLAIAEGIFEHLLASDLWEVCAAAGCRSACPIFRNVSLIQDNFARVRERLFLAYRRIYEYGDRLTLRQLCAHMAYMITAGQGCSDAIRVGQRARRPLMADFQFFNRFFGDDGRDMDTPALQLRAVRVVRQQAFGSQPCPTWERRMWLQSVGGAFRLAASTEPEDFRRLRDIGAGVEFDATILRSQARNQVRRALFFLHDFGESDEDSFVRSFLRSGMLPDFVRWQHQADDSLGLSEANYLRTQIMHVLQEQFTGIRFPERARSDHHLLITLNRHSRDVRQSTQVVLARYLEDDFRVRLVSHRNPAGTPQRELILEGPARDGHVRLSLSLPFLDYVMLRNRGEIGKALQASYVDRLERFKGQLLRDLPSARSEGVTLVKLRADQTFRRHMFAVRNGRLEVTDA